MTDSATKKLCIVYKSLKEEGMYLFVDKQDQLERVPEALLSKFGEPQLVTILALTPERKMARANATKVLSEIEERGFYLQIPLSIEEYMMELRNKNSKL